MKPKNFILLFIFGFFLFLLPSGAEAYCNATILGPSTQSGSCSIYFTGPLDLSSEPYIGIISQYAGQYDEGLIGGDLLGFCADSDGWTAQTDKIPGGYPSRQFCTVIHNQYVFPGCIHCVQPGLFDAGAGKCVRCDAGTKTESRILGTTSQLYDPCSDPPGITGDGKCESACGASPECDEVTYGSNVSVSGGVCNYCVFTASKPDLIITDIWPDGSTVKYSIKNQGNASAGASNSYLYVDGSYKASDSVSSLAAGASSNEAFSYDWIANCTGTYDTIKVCADGGGAVSESNEDNNCREETWDCPLPDLQITYIVFDSNKRVNYSVYNYGTAAAGSSYSYLYVDGSYKTSDSVSSLNANNGRDEYFSGWTGCTTGQSYSIEVCADRAGPSGAAASGGGDVIESNETNNCRTESLTCPACAGTVSLSLSPNPANPSTTITATVSGLSICDGTTARIRENSCSGTQKCTCSISGSGCSCTFTGPASAGTYTYYACVDKNADGDYSDSGESDWEDLVVQAGCTGTVSLSLSPNPAGLSVTITGTVSGLSGCNGKTAYIKQDSCSGTQKCTCSISGSGCSCTFTGPASAGTYTYYACVDKNADSDFADTGEAGSTTLTVQAEAFDFSISVNPTSGSVTQGGSVSATVTATLTSGTTQSVSFYIGSGLPSDASASFSPSSCNPTCSSSMTISTLATTPAGTYQLTVCGTTGTITRCYSYYELTVTEAGAAINPPQVRTVPISEQGTVTTDSATIWGELTDMGGTASCLVWFEYKKNTDTEWIKVCEETKYSLGSFSCPLSELTPNTNYVFEAFAKNGGSW